MLHRQGFTLIEMIIVLIIIAIVAVLSFPNFNTPTEQARALNAWNNLLAIYSAEKNYYNNNGFYCNKVPPLECTSLPEINASLSLNIQDDGTYQYYCAYDNTCTAARLNASSSPVIKVNLTLPIQLNQNNPNPNPRCTAGPNLCP